MSGELDGHDAHPRSRQTLDRVSVVMSACDMFTTYRDYTGLPDQMYLYATPKAQTWTTMLWILRCQGFAVHRVHYRIAFRLNGCPLVLGVLV